MPSSTTSPAFRKTGRVEAEADARGSAGADHVAGQERHEPAQVAHQRRHVEDHLVGVAALPLLAVDGEPEGELLRVGDLVRCREERAERREGVLALALRPLAAALELVLALRVVVVEGVAGHVRGGVLARHVAGPAADHDRQLHLPVGLHGAAGEDEVVVRAAQRGRGLEEDDRLVGDLRAGLAGVVGVVEADADDLGGPGHAGAEPLALRHARGRGGVLARPGREPGEAVRAEEALVPVRAEGRGVDAGAVAEDEAGLLRARRAEPDELHSPSPCAWRQRSIATATTMITPMRISCT